MGTNGIPLHTHPVNPSHSAPCHTVAACTLAGVAPDAKQLLLTLFDGGQVTNIQSVVTQAASPNVVLGSTAGFYNGADGLHPFGFVFLLILNLCSCLFSLLMLFVLFSFFVVHVWNGL